MITKRLILVSVLVLVAAPVLAGCASNNTTTTSNPTTSTPANKYSPKIFGSEGLFNEAGPAQQKDLATKAGCTTGSPPCSAGAWLASGVQGTNPASGDLTTFNTKFRAAYGHDPAQYAAESYDAVMYIALGALEAQSVAGKDIKSHMLDVADAPGTPCNTWATCSTAIITGQDIDYKGAAHDFTFDANHEPTKGIYDVWEVQADGSTKIIAENKTVAGNSSSNTTVPGTNVTGTPITPKSLELKLGTLMPLTGQLASLGPDMQKGAKLAVDEINTATATTMLKVTEFDEDDKTSDSAAITGTFDKLVGEGVTAIAGPCCSGVTGALLDKAIQNQIVIASPSATSPSLTLSRADPTNGGYFWRVAPSDAIQGKVISSVITDAGVKTVSIIYVNNAYGTGLKSVFTSTFGAANIKTAQSYNEQNTGDFTAQVTAACAQKADALVIFGYIDDGANVLKEMEKEGCLGK